MREAGRLSFVARLSLSRGLPRLPDRSGLGSLAEQVVQLTGPDGRDQGVDHE